MTDTSAFWDDFSRDLEAPVLRDAFVAASEEIAATDEAADAAREQVGGDHELDHGRHSPSRTAGLP